MRHLGRNNDTPLSEELTGLIGRLKPTKDSFALLLAHEYTKQSITDLGTRALKSIDHARVDALEEANAMVPAKKKLHFYIAELTHDVGYYDTGGDWEENERDESIKWYSTGGESHGSGAESEVSLNFLNPGRDTLSELWEGHGNSTFEGYLGNEGATRNTVYSWYAIVGWPAVHCVENALKFININAALGALQAQKSIDAATLRSFMTAVADASCSVKFCRALCNLLVQVRDPSLVTELFNNFFSRLDEKEALVPSLS